MELFTQAPLWVWPLLALLIVAGLRALRDRRAPIWLTYAMPAFVLLALRTLGTLEPGISAWVIFGVVWGIAGLLGYRIARRWVLYREGSRVHLRGEVVTLVALMVIFWANFAAGVLDATAPEVLHSSFGLGLFAAVLAAT